MEKIGTHNSGTGERPKGLLSWIGLPFAKCQTKTIREQYEAGARMFDLRVKLVNDDWHLAHGLWVSHRTLLGTLIEINDFPEVCRVMITYEGSDKDKAFRRFCEMTDGIESGFLTTRFVYIAVKKPTWEILRMIDRRSQPEQGFVPITGWRKLLPIPWLWHVIRSLRYFRGTAATLDVNTSKWRLVDFL